MFGKRNVWSQKQNSGFVEASSEICKTSKEHVTTCKDHVIGREITILLEISVDNVILELCGSCDHFANLYSWKKNTNLIMTFKKESCCFIVLLL